MGAGGARAHPAGETTVRPGRIDFDVSLLDLNVSVNVTRDGGLDVRVVANADLYDPATVGLIAEALDVAFGAFATAPDTAVSALELLPATDLAALSAPPAAAEAHRPESFVGGSPRTERALIALLEELLDVTGIDREDNFFAVGGDSIVSVQLAARATAQGLALTPAMVFETMSIAELAAAVDAATDAAAAQQDPGRQAHAEPMSASGLDADALARLTASWQRNA